MRMERGDPNTMFGTVTIPFATICNDLDEVPKVVESNGKKFLHFRILCADMIGRDNKCCLDAEVTQESQVKRFLKYHLITPGMSYTVTGKLKTVKGQLVLDVDGLFSNRKEGGKADVGSQRTECVSAEEES